MKTYVIQEDLEDGDQGIAKIVLSIMNGKSWTVPEAVFYLRDNQRKKGIPYPGGRGSLYWMTPATLEFVLTQLLAEKYLEKINVDLVMVTDTGRKFIKGKKELQLFGVMPQNPSKPPVAPKLEQKHLETLVQLKAGKTVDDLYKERKVWVDDIYEECAALIAAGKLKASDIFNNDLIKQIIRARKKIGANATPEQIKELIPEVPLFFIGPVVFDKNLK